MATVEEFLARFEAEGLDVIKAGVRDLGLVGAQSFAQIAESALKGDFVGLAAAINPIAGAFVAVAQAAGEFFVAQERSIAGLAVLRDATGLTVEEFYGLKNAMAEVGIDGEGFERIMSRAALAIQRAFQSAQRQIVEDAKEEIKAHQSVADAILARERAAQNLASVKIDQKFSGQEAGLKEAENNQKIAQSAGAVAAANRNVEKSYIDREDAAENTRGAEITLEEALIRQREAHGGASETDAEKKKIAREKADLAVEKAQTALEKAQLQEEAGPDNTAQAQLQVQQQSLALQRAQLDAQKDAAKETQRAAAEQLKLKEAMNEVAKAEQAVANAMQEMAKQAQNSLANIQDRIRGVIDGTKTWADVTANGQVPMQKIAEAFASMSGGSAAKELKDLATVFQQGDMSGAEKLAVATKVLGQSNMHGVNLQAAELVEMLSKGGPALQQFIDKMKAMDTSGLVEAENNAKGVVAELGRLSNQADNAKNSIANLVTEMLKLAAKSVTITVSAQNNPVGTAGFAAGGIVNGPGSGTSDTAGLFALSDGEGVIRAAAVNYYGEGFIHAINAMAVGKFAGGGIAGSGVRGGGPNLGTNAGGPMSILNLSIDGNHFDGLKAPDSVAARLKTYAVHRQAASAGRKPSWMS